MGDYRLAVDGFALTRFLRSDADLFVKLQVFQQNAADLSASAWTQLSLNCSGKYCGPAFAVDGLFISHSSHQGRLLSPFALR